MKTVDGYGALEELGRVRLSRNFFMRDFLHSEIAAWHGFQNLPEDADAAIAAGRRLCEELLEPLQASFGRLHIRSGYRSLEVNAFGNANGLNCASNEANYAAHIWDRMDAAGRRGATACIVVPWLVDHVAQGGRWESMAWWIHDHLPYSRLTFFKNGCAFNIQWREQPERRIDSFVLPKGCLTKPGMSNHGGQHAVHYIGFPAIAQPAGIRASPPDPTAPLPPVSDAARPSPPTGKRLAPRVSQGPLSLGAEPIRVSSTPSGQQILYRAVHTRTTWRKARNHQSMERAIRGKDGAKALFAGTVRIDYQKHGEPVLVLVWDESASDAYVVSADPSAADGIRVQSIPAERAWTFEQQGGITESELRRLVTL